LGNFFYISRLTTFAAIRHRRQEWAIGFQHELVHWRGRQRVANVLPVLKGQNPGETDQRTEAQDAPHGGCVLRETVEYAAHSRSKRLEMGKRIFLRIALVDDAVQSEFGSDFKMLAEQLGLLPLVRLVLVGSGSLPF